MMVVAIVSDEVEACPVSIPATKPPTNKANPRVGVSMAAFSADCKYMYTKNGEHLHLLHLQSWLCVLVWGTNSPCTST